MSTTRAFTFHYGVPTIKLIDVTDKVYSTLVKDGKLSIEHTVNLDDHFGDPVYGEVKKLVVCEHAANVQQQRLPLSRHRQPAS